MSYKHRVGVKVTRLNLLNIKRVKKEWKWLKVFLFFFDEPSVFSLPSSVFCPPPSILRLQPSVFRLQQFHQLFFTCF